MENGHRSKMFPDVLVLSLAVGSAPRDKAMRFAALCPRACTRSFPFLSLAKQSLRPNSKHVGGTRLIICRDLNENDAANLLWPRLLLSDGELAFSH